MDLHYKVKFEEGFKDGNILDKEMRAGEEVVLRKDLYERCVQSGAVLEILETLVPNPLKHEVVEEVVHDVSLPVVGQEPEAEKFNAKYERWAQEDGEALNENTVLVRKKGGRPKGSKNKAK